MSCRDRSALIAKFEAHYQELLRFLARRIGDSDRAADVAQETFLRLATASALPPSIDNPRAYLYRVAGNLATDAARSEVRRAGRTATVDHADALPDPTPSPEAALLARERLAILDEALARLPAKPRRALLMSRVEGLTFAEIAAELGVSESMVAKYVAQALRACRDQLREAYREI